MSKISFDQVLQPNDCEIFLCSNSNEMNHILENAVVCTGCQRMICKSCFFSCKKCPICERSFETPKDIPEMLKLMLNQLMLRCENYKNGCLVEITYEKYRSHTKNCKFKVIVPKIEEIHPTQHIIPENSLKNKEPNKFPETKPNAFPIFNKTLNSLNNLMEPPLNPNVFKPMEPPPIPKNTAFIDNLENYKKNFEENLSLSQMKMLITKSISECESKEDLEKVLDFYQDSFKKTHKKPSNINNFLSINQSISEENSEKNEESEMSDISETSEKSGGNLKTSGKLYFQSLPDRVLKKFRQTDFSYLQVDDLKVLLERRNLPKVGNKEDLIQRLREYLNNKNSRNSSAFPDTQHKIKKKISKEEKLKLFQKLLKEFK